MKISDVQFDFFFIEIKINYKALSQFHAERINFIQGNRANSHINLEIMNIIDLIRKLKTNYAFEKQRRDMLSFAEGERLEIVVQYDIYFYIVYDKLLSLISCSRKKLFGGDVEAKST